MRKLYPYVGPKHIAGRARSDSPRSRIASQADALDWASTQGDPNPDESFTATFVVLPDGLWVADRRSEHVACARGAAVLSAGEMTFAGGSQRDDIEVVDVTNQSTGYCPEPSSWASVAAALDAAGIAHPTSFTAEMVFRRCPACGTTNIVKDGWFVCAVCGADLPQEWNYGGPSDA